MTAGKPRLFPWASLFRAHSICHRAGQDEAEALASRISVTSRVVYYCVSFAQLDDVSFSLTYPHCSGPNGRALRSTCSIFSHYDHQANPTSILFWTAQTTDKLCIASTTVPRRLNYRNISRAACSNTSAHDHEVHPESCPCHQGQLIDDIQTRKAERQSRSRSAPGRRNNLHKYWQIKIKINHCLQYTTI